MRNSNLWEAQILSLVPRHPNKTTVDKVHKSLKDLGYDKSKKTVLRALQDSVGIACDNRSRPYGFSRVVDLLPKKQQMDPVESMAYLFMKETMTHIMPKQLQQFIHQKASNANKNKNSKLISWPKKISNIGRGFQLKHAQLSQNILDNIHEALLNEKQISFTHKGKEDTRIHPLGIVFREQVVYLICSFYDYNKPLQLAIHRMSDVVILEDDIIKPDDFSLEGYISNGELGYLKSKRLLKLKLLMTDTSAKHLHETPISDDQTIKPLDDGKTLVSATVKDSQDLRWWILGFGGQVEVKQPKALREEIKTSIEQAYKHYKA